MGFTLIAITKSNKAGKKMMAKFKNKETGRESTTHFGATGYDDYTITKNKEQRARYRQRHKGDNLTKIYYKFGDPKGSSYIYPVNESYEKTSIISSRS